MYARSVGAKKLSRCVAHHRVEGLHSVGNKRVASWFPLLILDHDRQQLGRLQIDPSFNRRVGSVCWHACVGLRMSIAEMCGLRLW